MEGLRGRSAIVTGGGDGIGKGVVRRLAREGVRVLLAEMNAESGQATAEAAAREFGVDVVFHQVDVTDRTQVEAMVAAADARFGGIDILVNNAWGSASGFDRIERRTDAQMQHGLVMALYAAMWAMGAAFSGMKARRWGRVINMCSLNGVNAHMYSADYNVGKEALRSYTRSAAREWAGHGITANVVCPAAESVASRQFRAANPEAAAAMMDAMNPMGRMGDPEADIGPVVAFLASEDSRYLTGNTLFVDGGSHINGVAWAPVLPPES